MDVVSMLAVVQQSHAVISVTEVGPTLRAHLEHPPSAAVIPMCRPAHVPELDFVGGLTRLHRDRKGDLEQLVLLLPVDLRVEAQHTPVEGDVLIDPRAAEVTADNDERVAVLDVDIPRV